MVVPGENTGEPWRIRRTHGDGIEKSQQHDLGDSSSECDPQLIEDKHEALKKQRNDAYASAAVGIVHSILLKCAADVEPVEKVLNPKAQKRKEADILDPEVAPARKARSKFCSIMSDSSDAPNSKTKKPRSRAMVTTEPAHVMPHVAPSSSCKPLQEALVLGCAPSTPPMAFPASGIAGAEGLATEKTGGKGRPQVAVHILADQLWESLAISGEGSIFFGPKSMSQQRSLARYVNVAGQRIASEKNMERAAKLHEGRKKLQIMETLVRIYMNWQKRKSVSSGVPMFCNQWEAMMAYCNMEDDCVRAVKLICPFMWETRLAVLVCGDPAGLAEALTTRCLNENFVKSSSDKVLEVQVKYIRQGITLHLTSSPSLTICQTALRRFSGLFMEEGKYEGAVQDDLGELNLVLNLPSNPFDFEQAGRLTSILNSCEDSNMAQACVPIFRPFFVPLLQYYPQFGRPTLSNARDFAVSAASCEPFTAAFRHQSEQVLEQSGEITQDNIDVSKACKYACDNHFFFLNLDQRLLEMFREHRADQYEAPQHAVCTVTTGRLVVSVGWGLFQSGEASNTDHDDCQPHSP